MVSQFPSIRVEIRESRYIGVFLRPPHYNGITQNALRLPGRMGLGVFQVYELVRSTFYLLKKKGEGIKVSFRSVKMPKRADRCILRM